ncbi:MAG: carboxy terminal-processing peptidase [Deltaproteobacteria bacterium]|nr:carboxy terminal-processing peptidase [Deltaproteobacteria bacterium]
MTKIPGFLKRQWLFTFVAFAVSLPLFALDCKSVKLITTLYLQTHFSQHVLDETISERTLKNFITAWDPGKVVFLKSDVERFFADYKKRLPQMIAQSDCSALNDIFNIYSQRFEEGFKDIKPLIDLKHDFTLDEHMNIDRKSLAYVNDRKELKERWRTRIKFQHMQLKETIPDDKEIREKLYKRYDLQLKRHHEINSDEVYEIFLDSVATALDPHSDYFSPSQLEDFHISTRLSLEGIGALLRSEEGITRIHSLVPGGAAEKSGKIMVGDKIVAVAQGKETPVDVIDMDLREVVKLIRGPRGTEVRLTIRRDGSEFIAPIIREKIELKDRATKSVLHEVQEMKASPQGPLLRGHEKTRHEKIAKTYKIGVIDLPSFYIDFEGRHAKKDDFRSSSRDIAKEIKKLEGQKADAIIVDLRSNGGGALDEAIDIAGLFLGPGPIVQVKKAQGNPYINTYSGKQIYQGPLILMINQQSASASEIMAAAIQDYERGLIVGGSHTFGKGTVQNVNDLDPKLGAIKVTISKFYRASGGSTQLKGVASDIVLPSIIEHYDIGEKFYDYALPWEMIKPVPHRNFNMIRGHLSALQLASAKRLKADEGFVKIQEAIKEYKEKEKERYLVDLKIKKKEKGKETEKLEAELEEDEDVETKLSDDLHLQETLRIATDYVRLLKKEKLSDLEIVSLKKEATKTAEKKKSSPRKTEIPLDKPESPPKELIHEVTP